MNIDEAIGRLKGIIYASHSAYFKNFELMYQDVDAIQTLINEYNNLKQIEEAHRIENGKLREELKRIKNIDIYKLIEAWETGQLISKDTIKQKYLELAYEQNEGKNIVENRYKMEVLEEIGGIYEIQ